MYVTTSQVVFQDARTKKDRAAGPPQAIYLTLGLGCNPSCDTPKNIHR